MKAPGTTGNPFVRFEHERAGAGAGAHRLVPVGLRIGGAHDDRDGGGRIAEAGQQHRERLLQFDREPAGIGDDERIDALGEQAAVDGADRPSLEGCDHVGAGDRGSIMERQAGTQDEVVLKAVRADAVALHHLRLRVELLVEAEQRLVDEVGKILRASAVVQVGSSARKSSDAATCSAVCARASAAESTIASRTQANRVTMMMRPCPNCQFTRSARSSPSNRCNSAMIPKANTMSSVETAATIGSTAKSM